MVALRKSTIRQKYYFSQCNHILYKDELGKKEEYDEFEN